MMILCVAQKYILRHWKLIHVVVNVRSVSLAYSEHILFVNVIYWKSIAPLI